MTRLSLIVFALLAACGSDVPSSRTAAMSQANEQARFTAQDGRIANPGAIACLNEVTTPEERSILAKESAEAEALLQDVLNREDMSACMVRNNVVVYL